MKFVKIVTCLILILIFTACNMEQDHSIMLDFSDIERETPGEEDTIENFIDLFDIDLENVSTPAPITLDTVGEDEYRIRFVFEALIINRQDIWRMEFGDELDEYGAIQRSLINDIYELNDLTELKILLNSQEFLDLFEGYNEKCVEHYFLPRNIKEDPAASIGFVDNVFYFLITGEPNSDNEFCTFVVVDTEQDVSVQEIASFYAQMDGLEVNTQQVHNNEIYYFTGKGSSILFQMFGPMETEQTVYLWEQDGVVGMIVVSGEHREQNVDLCVLEKHNLDNVEPVKNFVYKPFGSNKYTGGLFRC